MDTENIHKVIYLVSAFSLLNTSYSLIQKKSLFTEQKTNVKGMYMFIFSKHEVVAF